MITIDWKTSVINIPREDMVLIQSNPVEIRELNLNDFRLTLKDLEDDPEGISFQKTHKHSTEVELGGITYARVIEILEPYTITFSDGQYAVNLKGANSNVGDRVNVNQVSVRSANSAGLVTAAAIDYDAIKDAVLDAETIDHAKEGTIGRAISDSAINSQAILDIEEGNWEIIGTQMIFKDKANVELFRMNLYDSTGKASNTEVFKRQRV